MWSEIVNGLSEYLHTALPGTVIRAGQEAGTPLVRTVEVVRGPLDLSKTRAGQVGFLLYLQCWDRDEDLSAANSKLDHLEQELIAAVFDWSRTQGVAGWHLTVTLSGATETDADAFRPSVGSRITLSIQGTREC